MNFKVTSVSITSHLNLYVTFQDGVEGRVLINPDWLTGVFEDLLNPDVFATVHVEHGAVTWDNGLDLDPKVMYDHIKSEGCYTVT